MAGRIIKNKIPDDTTWISEVETENVVKKGLYNLSFTNMEIDGLPEIVAGSSVEINGLMITFDSNTAITGSVIEGDNYVIIDQNGNASFTSEAPTFDFYRKGSYDGDRNRYVLGFSGLTYSDKYTIEDFGTVPKWFDFILYGLGSIKNIINDLFSKVGQDLNIDSDVQFNSVSTDGPTYIKEKIYSGTLITSRLVRIATDLSAENKVRSVTAVTIGQYPPNYNDTVYAFETYTSNSVIYLSISVVYQSEGTTVRFLVRWED